MSRDTARQRASSLLRFLEQRSEQLENFHAANYRLVIRDFLDFFVRDDVCGKVAEQLHRRIPRAAKSWHDEATQKSALPPLPADAAGAMAFRYAFLRLVGQDKVDLRFFVTNLYPGAHLNERLMNWKRQFVHPFGDDLRTLARGVQARLGDEEWVDLSQLVEDYLDGPFAQEGFGPRAWSDEDDRRVEDASRPAAGGDEDPLEEALADLEREVLGLPEGERGDLAIDVRVLALETRRHRFARERFLARLDGLAAREPLRAACAAVRERLPGG